MALSVNSVRLPDSSKNLPSETASRPVTPNNIEKVFALAISKDGSIELKSSPNTGKKRSTIYSIWDAETGATYIGKTDQEFRKRLSQHRYHTNHPEAPGSDTDLYRALRENPKNFRFGVLKQAEPSLGADKLSQLERHHISLIPEDKKLNSNSGGGGGTSVKVVASASKENLLPEEVFATPPKYYRAKKYKGDAIKFDLPKEVAVSKGSVYVIKEESTGKRYIGYTGQEIGKRCSQHIHQAKRFKQTKESKDSKTLHEAIQKNPEDFGIGLLARNVELKKLPELEAKYIKMKDSITNGFNKNHGGGGSHVSDI
jgi:hypothetical protein